MEDDDRGRGAAAGGGAGSMTSVTLERAGRRRESMPGEFFTVLFSKNTNEPFFYRI